MGRGALVKWIGMEIQQHSLMILSSYVKRQRGDIVIARAL